MKAPFSPQAHRLARLVPPLVVLGAVVAAAVAWAVVRSPTNTGVGWEIRQPIPFSHEHHVRGLGLDCRYCHTDVERGANAGYPDTNTCYGCHREIWKDAPILESVRASATTGRPLFWWRVHQLPDYVFFDHHIHVQKGIGCVTCHGRVSEMRLVSQQRSFIMRDCLSCHRAPERQVRPVSEVLNENLPPASLTEGRKLMQTNGVQPPPLTDCIACHR